MNELEMCIICDEPTGCAGEGKIQIIQKTELGHFVTNDAEKEGVYND